MSLLAARGVAGRAERRPRVVGVVAASVFLGALVIAAIMPGVVTTFDPIETSSADSLLPPSLNHLFGTDLGGRDVFARVVHGAQYSLLVGFGASAAALLAGLFIGSIAGLAPKIIDGAISRLIAIAMAFPEFLLALLVIGILGPGPGAVVAAIAIAAAPVYARVARAQAIVVVQSHYVRAAEVLGVSPLQRVVQHVLPNTVQPLLVLATMGVGTAIVSAAGLSFLGLGATPPTPEWGVIMAEGSNLLGTAWWITFFPGLVITATVISTSVLGRYLQSRGAGRLP